MEISDIIHNPAVLIETGLYVFKGLQYFYYASLLDKDTYNEFTDDEKKFVDHRFKVLRVVSLLPTPLDIALLGYHMIKEIINDKDDTIF
ncbi:MAG: hypothetical protein AABW52_00315 [Nanoarchaeota archaeon]